MAGNAEFWDEPTTNNLRRLLDKRGWSQSELARRSGVSQTHIGTIVRGESTCTTQMAELLAKPFGLKGWHLALPDLPDDLIDSSALQIIVETYLRANKEGRDHLESTAAFIRRNMEHDQPPPRDGGTRPRPPFAIT